MRCNFWANVYGDVATSSGDLGILKNKRSNVELASIGNLRPLIQWSPICHMFTKKSSTPLFSTSIGEDWW